MKKENIKRQFTFVLIITVIFFVWSGCSIKKTDTHFARKGISIVPIPAEIDRTAGEFLLKPSTGIFLSNGNNELERIGKYLAGKIYGATGNHLKIEKMNGDKKGDGIILILNENNPEPSGKESYELSVFSDKIILEASHSAGLFYAVQTLLQLFPPEIENKNSVETDIKWIVPCVLIKDKPRYRYRGMHLDVCRHFFPKEFIKKYIDLIAMYKFNVFHWHLTEDQGWRIEIRRYPLLTTVGSRRKERDGTVSNGFYTQKDIKEIVQYAKERYITVIPEIEMPGHATAALAAYPHLSCTGGAFNVENRWGIFEDVYCAGNENTFVFLENVLAEVVQLFPSPYIHIGGDECPKIRWKKCLKCQERMKKEGLEDEDELQSYFIKRIEKFLISKNKRLIGWDEILEGGLAPEATVMSWRGVNGGIAAAKQKHDVIMTPTSHCYFDYYQGDSTVEPLTIGGFNPLKNVYSFDPTPGELSEAESKYILGVQGNVWTEYMLDSKTVEYMMAPRMCALAEVSWSPIENKNWDDFSARMGTQYRRLDQKNVYYHVPIPEGGFNKVVILQDTTIELSCSVKDAKIHYTLDGSEPIRESAEYTKPLNFNKDAEIKVCSILPHGKKSIVRTIVIDKQTSKKPVRIRGLTQGLDFKYFEGFFKSG